VATEIFQWDLLFSRAFQFHLGGWKEGAVPKSCIQGSSTPGFDGISFRSDPDCGNRTLGNAGTGERACTIDVFAGSAPGNVTGRGTFPCPAQPQNVEK